MCTWYERGLVFVMAGWCARPAHVDCRFSQKLEILHLQIVSFTLDIRIYVIYLVI